MITTLLFDVDGVLAVGEPFYIPLERSHGITRAQTAAFLESPERWFYRCQTGQADLREVIPPYLRQWGWPASVDDFLAYWHTVENVVDERVLDMVDQLRARGYRCYLATNQERYRAAYILNEMGFAQHFAGMFASYSQGCLKSDPRFFTSLLQQLPGTEPQQVMYWDDGAAYVETARRVGIRAEVYRDFAIFNQQAQDLLT